MKKQFVTQEIALKLKELGFDEGCLAVYDSPDFKLIHELLGHGWNSLELINGEVKNSIYSEGDFVTAPLWQQATDWLQFKYNIHIMINFENWDDYVNSFIYTTYLLYQSEDLTFINKKKSYADKVRQSVRRKDNSQLYFISYESAREECILQAIKLIESRV